MTLIILEQRPVTAPISTQLVYYACNYRESDSFKLKIVNIQFKVIPDKNRTENTKIAIVSFDSCLIKKFTSVYSGPNMRVVSVASTIQAHMKQKNARVLKKIAHLSLISIGSRES